MKFEKENFKEKFTGFCRKVGKRNFIIIGAVVLIVGAVCVNLAVFSSKDKDGYDYDKSAGMTGTDTGTPTVADTTAGDSYFASAQVSRQRTRDEAIEVLQGVVDNKSSTEAAKNEALTEINKLAQIMAKEANIETLIVAKGFKECVAVINGESASIVVSSDGLLPAEISQINEIVYEQAGILPVNINIIER